MSQGICQAVENCDTRQLRQWFGQYATGVTIITTLDEAAKPVGMTANSFSSVSLEPALISWNIAKSASQLKSFTECESFAVNILSEQQQALSNHFAKSHPDKFLGLQGVEYVQGLPVFTGAITQFICRTQQVIEAGDHYIILALVEYCVHHGGNPLIFHSGKYVQLLEQQAKAQLSKAV